MEKKPDSNQNSDMPQISEDYLIPIVVGVSGRQGLQTAGENIASLIIREMHRLRNTFPSSPFIVISTLTSREDCLLVRLAAEHLSAKLIAVLPSAPEQYKSTLTDDSGMEEFMELLGMAESSIDISSLIRSRLGRAVPVSTDDTESVGRFAAAFIAEHSEVLFAVCGEGDNGRCATAEMMKWIRGGSITREFSLGQNKQSLDTMDTSMIIEIDPASGGVRIESAPADDGPARGKSGSKDQDGLPVYIWRVLSLSFFGLVQKASASLDELYDSFIKRASDADADKYERTSIVRIMERIDGFNHDIGSYFENHGDKDFKKSGRYLLGDEWDNERIAGDRSLRKIISLYTGSDVLSQYYQKKTASLVNWIYILFFAAVVLYGMIDWNSYLVLCYIGLLPAIALLVKKTSRDRIEDRFLDYRALAEGLRVQFFWTLSGINENVSAHYLSKYEGLLTWIRKAVRSIEILTLQNENAGDAHQKNESLGITRRLWIESQLAYFSSKKKPLLIRTQQFGNVVFLSFVLTLIVALAFGIYLLIAGVGNGEAINDFQILLGVIAAVGVAAQAYKNKRAYDELQRRYSLAEKTYAAARRELEVGGVSPERVLLAVGREALLENSDWLWTHRNLPIELPKG